MDRRRTGFGQGCNFCNRLKDRDLYPLMDRMDIHKRKREVDRSSADLSLLPLEGLRRLGGFLRKRY